MNTISSFFSSIGQALANLFRKIKNFFVKVIKRALNFFRDVVNWFKQLDLNPENHTPFVTDAKKLKEMIHNAPIVDCGIFEGVYNAQTEEIEHYQEISAEGMDEKTKEILSQAKEDNPIVVLN
ncbi:MAG: hypothetical protein K6F30_03165 [Lachnospiraceae bacterium]|nr:hypothetical protein [Lachnospiraceae bacterium]